MDRKPKKVKLPSYKKHPRRQWFYFDGEPVGCWVKLQFHRLDCDCKEKDVEYKICPKLYSCDCYEYVHNYLICSHIHRIHRSFNLAQISEIFLEEELEIQAVTVLDIMEMMSMCTNDQFPYKKFFLGKYDLSIEFTTLGKLLWWPGYELMIKRHELGLTYLRYEIERTEAKSWKITRVRFNEIKQRRKIKQKYITRTIPVELTTITNVDCVKDCDICHSFNKCMVCNICAHMYYCECRDHQNGFTCQHCHAVDLYQTRKNTVSYKLPNDFFNYRYDILRNYYFLYIHNRVRHNVALSMEVTDLDFGTPVEKLEIRRYIVEDGFECQQTKLYALKYIVNLKCTDCVGNQVCPMCCICRHQYICNCGDYERGFICSHMHAASISTIVNVVTRKEKVIFNDDTTINNDEICEILQSCSMLITKNKRSKKRWSSRLKNRNKSNRGANLETGPDSTRNVAIYGESVTDTHEEELEASLECRASTSGLDSVAIEIECSTDKVKKSKKRRSSRLKKKNESSSNISDAIRSSAGAASDNTVDVQNSVLVEIVEGIDLEPDSTRSVAIYGESVTDTHEEELEASLECRASTSGFISVKVGDRDKSIQDKPQTSNELDSVTVENECSTDTVKKSKKRRSSRLKKKNESSSNILDAIRSSTGAASGNNVDVQNSVLVELVEGINLEHESRSSIGKFEQSMEAAYKEELDGTSDRQLACLFQKDLSLGESCLGGLYVGEHKKEESTDVEKNKKNIEITREIPSDDINDDGDCTD